MRILLGLFFIFCIVVVSMVWHLSQLQSRLINSSALSAAELYSVALTQFRTLYTSEVVNRARKQGLDATHDYASRNNTIPLPATLSMLLGKEIGKHASGAKARLHSPYPFPWRKKAKKIQTNDFDKKAWNFLSVNPRKPYYQFDNLGGKKVLRYATADIMRTECISCHNSHPDSPKRDWKVGDVRGVLEITLPLGDITTQTNTDLRNTSFAYIFIGLGIVFLIGFVFVRLRKQSDELQSLVTVRTAELQSEVDRRQLAMEALVEVEERNRRLLDSAGKGIYGLDLEGCTTFINPAVCRMLGYAEAELIGQPMHALVHHSYPDGTKYPREKCPMYAAFRDGQVHRVSNEVLWRKDGSSLPIEYTSTPMRKQGKIVGAVVVFNDISERKMMEERFQSAIKASPTATIMVDERGLILNANNEAMSLFGYSSQQLVGEPVEILLPDSVRAKHPSLRKGFLSDPSVRRMGMGRDLLAQKKGGEEFPVEVGLSPIDTPDGIVVLCSIVDLTERKKSENIILQQSKQLEEANKLLSEQATTDSLTNIANRRGFVSQLKTLLMRAHRNGQPISMIMADIDFFKQYNDDFGHLSGDEVLQAVAKVFVGEARGNDFVARFGGEEFAVLLPETNRDGSLIAAERIRKSIEGISVIERKITMSLGVATLEVSNSNSFDTTEIGNKLIEQADKALYSSKKNGRNRVTYFK